MPPPIQSLTCRETAGPVLLRESEGPPEGLLLFLDGLGLDGSGFRAFLENLERPSFRYRYPYLAYRHLVPTIPGFGPPAPGPLPLRMAEQAERLARLVDRHLEACGGRLVVYGFSFGSDLAIELLDALSPEAREGLRRVVMAEPNTHAGSCFLSSRIAVAFEQWRRSPRGARSPFEAFRKAVLQPHMEGSLPREHLDDITRYCQEVQDKDWAQLAASAREISVDPSARLGRLFRAIPALPHCRFELLLSSDEDLQALLDLVATRPEGTGLPSVIHTRGLGHFHHAKPMGVLENLRGHELEVPLPG